MTRRSPVTVRSPEDTPGRVVLRGAERARFTQPLRPETVARLDELDRADRRARARLRDILLD